MYHLDGGVRADGSHREANGLVARGLWIMLSLSVALGASAQVEVKCTASDGAASDRFGWSVALSGDYALVGAIGYEGIAPSIRLKALRDSIEDYEYLTILERLDREAAAEIGGVRVAK